MLKTINSTFVAFTDLVFSYRLGAFGFLASEELRADNKADGGVGNYAIRDQITAYEWVKKNIAAWGGDPTKITAMGHSAGAGQHSIVSLSKMLS